MHIDGTRFGLKAAAFWRNRGIIGNRLGSLGNSDSADDALKISDLGKKLKFISDKTSIWSERLTSSQDSREINLMDETISKLGETLEEMKKLSTMAQDTQLSDADRLRLQIKMRGLQETAKQDIWSMGLKMAGKSDEEVASLAGAAHIVFEQGGGSYGMPSDMSGQENPDMLERALARAESAQEWDVAEVMESVDQLSEVKVIQGPSVSVTGSWDDSQLPEGVDPDAPRMYVSKAWKTRYKVVDDPETPTVRQRLEADPRVIMIMDSESAAKATERINREIDKLKELREEFFSAIDHGSSETSNNGDSPEESISKYRVNTGIGTLVSTQDEPGDFRLESPKGTVGAFFARLDSIMKDRIARNLGIIAPDGYEPELYSCVHTFV